MYSYETVKKILETAIDSLVDNFASEPYIHRCEHSLHCELYNMLIVHRALQGLYPLKNGAATKTKNLQGLSTALIHKEWPETKARPGKNGRRGNFDLVILDPKEIRNSTVTDFTAGRIPPGQIPPAFVVEMGLNYTLEKHLRKDDFKLTNSGFEKDSECKKYGYLVHLWQPHKGISDSDVTKLLDWIPKSKNMVAAVVFIKGVPMVKHLHDQNLAYIGKS